MISPHFNYPRPLKSEANFQPKNAELYTWKASTLSWYNELRKEYSTFGVSYSRQKLLRKLSKDSPLHCKKDKSYFLFNWVADILLLNQLEIVYWHCLLQSTSKSERAMDAKYLAVFTAFMAKQALSEDIEPFESCLTSKFYDFKLRFRNWQLVTDCNVELDLKEINQKFSYLLGFEKPTKNYEKMVNYLMPSPERKESHTSETRSDDSAYGDLETELQAFEHNMMGGEKLSPIYSYV